MAVGVACGAERLFKICSKSRFFPAASVRNACFIALFAWIVWQGHEAARYEHPIYNGTWDRLMTFFREETPENSIVTSWWCPGHYITSLGKRRVTFDGATQNTPQIYWVANLFLEKSERNAASILRMLDLSGNDAVDFLTGKEKEGENAPDGPKMKLADSVNLLHRILPLGEKEALASLKGTLSDADASKLIGMTHGTHAPAPGYLFIYNDMVDQVMALEYTGKWDFNKVENFQNRLESMPAETRKKLLNRNSREHVILTWSLSDGPYAQDKEAFEDHKEGSDVYFTNGLVVDLDSMDARLFSRAFGTGKPRYLYYLKDDHLERKTVPDGDLNVSALLIRDDAANAEGGIDTTYRSVIADERLIESLIFRLYYLKGAGLKYFHPAAAAENASDRTKVYAYKVDWDQLEA